LEIEIINKFIQENKFNELNSYLEQKLTKEVEGNINFELVTIFNLAVNLKEKISGKNFYYFWKRLILNGKVKLANESAEVYLSYLIKYKRINRIKKFLFELETTNKKSNFLKYQEIASALLGKKEPYKKAKEKEEIVDWRESVEVELKEKIKGFNHWNLEIIKLIYEYVLKYYFNEEVFLKFKNEIYKNEKYKSAYLKLLSNKKVNIEVKKISEKNSINLKVDYDQLAYEIISGKVDSLEVEQSKIIVSIGLMDEAELLKNGIEMIIAFRLLEMEIVVIYLCDLMLQRINNDQAKANLYFMKTEMLFDNKKFFEAKEVIHFVLNKVPLLVHEKIGFLILLKNIYELEKKNENLGLIKKEIAELKKTVEKNNLNRIS
jgi:hypothetical protein